MKKLLLLLSFLFVGLTTFATTPTLELDETELQDEFKSLDKIENFILENEGITLEEMKSNHSDIIEGVDLATETMVTFSPSELPLVGGFWYGCCLGPVGLALVYFITDNDREQVKNALIGCVITTVVGGGLFGIFGNPF